MRSNTQHENTRERLIVIRNENFNPFYR